MKIKSLLPLLLMPAILITPYVFAEELKVDSNLSKVVSSCKKSKSPTTVYFFKQWHLASGVNTRSSRAAYPQQQNLESIYAQLDQWIQKKKIGDLIAEGCTGTIDENSSYRVNGWSVKDLQAERASPQYQKIGTSIPLKLEAKYGDQINTICGDSEELVKEQLLAFSDARGDVGYLSRITQYKDNPEKLKPCLSDAIGLLKLPQTASFDDVVTAMKSDLKKAIQRIHATIDKRNSRLVEAAVSLKAKNIGVVYGGMHAEGVKKLLEEKGLNCFIIEPVGYQNDEALLVEQLERAVEKI